MFMHQTVSAPDSCERGEGEDEWPRVPRFPTMPRRTRSGGDDSHILTGHIPHRLNAARSARGSVDDLAMDTDTLRGRSGQIGAYGRGKLRLSHGTPWRERKPRALGAAEDDLRSLGGHQTAAASTTWVLYRVKVQIEAPWARCGQYHSHHSTSDQYPLRPKAAGNKSLCSPR